MAVDLRIAGLAVARAKRDLLRDNNPATVAAYLAAREDLALAKAERSIEEALAGCDMSPEGRQRLAALVAA